MKDNFKLHTERPYMDLQKTDTANTVHIKHTLMKLVTFKYNKLWTKKTFSSCYIIYRTQRILFRWVFPGRIYQRLSFIQPTAWKGINMKTAGMWAIHAVIFKEKTAECSVSLRQVFHRYMKEIAEKDCKFIWLFSPAHLNLRLKISRTSDNQI